MNKKILVCMVIYHRKEGKKIEYLQVHFYITDLILKENNFFFVNPGFGVTSSCCQYSTTRSHEIVLTVKFNTENGAVQNMSLSLSPFSRFLVCND